MMVTFKLPPFPTFIIGGTHTFLKGKKHFKRTYTVFDLLYVKRGTLYMSENEMEYKVNEGEYILLSPGLEHYGHKGCDERTDVIWFHFSVEGSFSYETNASLQWRDLFQKEGTFTEPAQFIFQIPTYGRFDNRAIMEQKLDELVHLNEYGSVENKLQQQMIFQEILIILQKEALAIPTAAERVCDKYIAYIRAHFKEDLSVQEVALKLHYHPDYIARSMKKTMGVGPVEYLQQYRISQSKILLATTDMKIKEVAEKVGIQDDTYFSRLFRKKEGVSPNRYRRFVHRSEG
ncbi:AraC family transcriptional regulator [Metabacillus iocasae]|uniref:AraC-like DNA-binding protein n=1 Tax=Priestia iocasae TaxID=2291674 RepID=A0ABS2QT38_9BACI|nr:AraC family transcriptional regulator [Metabacillus iocasae]MBM7702621.1 AraC-like DNA-binding protein [Metabacillus iocasae]